MVKKHIQEVLLVFLASVFILNGCGRSNRVVNYPVIREDSISITFFGNKYDSENVTVIEEIISDFMVQNPHIQVSYESLKGSEYYDALSRRMAAGKGDDVFMVNHDAVLELKEAGRLADLSGLSVIPEYSPQMLGQMKEEDGSIFWVPTTVSVFGLYCNMDLLKAHGQKVPENLSQWESVCQYFLEQGITPIIANNDISLKTIAIGSSFYTLYQEDRQWEVFDRFNQNEEVLSKYLSSGFSLVSGLIEKGYVNAGEALVTQKTSDDLAVFAEGNAPFMLTGAWAVAHLKSLNPKFDFQVYPYPILEDGVMEVINADTRLSVNADSPHQEAAMAFVEFFTKEENIQKFADQQSSFSPLQVGRPSSSKEIHPLIPCYQSGRVVIGADAYLEYPIWDLTAQVSEMLLSGESLETVMDWMDKQAQGEALDNVEQ